MSNFITRDDYDASIRATKLEQLLQGNDTVLDLAEATAVQTVRDALVARYDLTAIFDARGTERAPNVLRWCVTLALYYLWDRAPDRLIPERVTANYEMTMAALSEISDGKSSVELPPKFAADGLPATKFRWGGTLPRDW